VGVMFRGRSYAVVPGPLATKKKGHALASTNATTLMSEREFSSVGKKERRSNVPSICDHLSLRMIPSNTARRMQLMKLLSIG
jgi:hypothetical protein